MKCKLTYAKCFAIFNCFLFVGFSCCSIQVKDAEALGFATIFRKALLYHPPSKNLPPNIVSHMLQHMFNLIAHFCEASVRAENVRIHLVYFLYVQINQKLQRNMQIFDGFFLHSSFVVSFVILEC